MKNLKKAVKWEVLEKGNERCIQLYDEHGRKIKDENAYWEGSFYCNYNKLTSLTGAPKEVGGYFVCYNNNLTSLTGAPKERGSDVDKRIFQAKLNRGYIFADGVLTKLISSKKVSDMIVYKTRYLGSDKIVFVVERSGSFAHGSSIKLAVEDLRYKISDRDTSEYENWTVNTKATKEEFITAYRKITGACAEGVKQFVNSENISDTLLVKDVIKLTNGQYGSDEFRNFFK